MADYNDIDDDIIVLHDDDGKEVRCTFLDLVEYRGKEYVILLPFLENIDELDEEVVIVELREDESGETESYYSVVDDDILSAVFEIFKENNKDEFDFS